MNTTQGSKQPKITSRELVLWLLIVGVCYGQTFCWQVILGDRFLMQNFCSLETGMWIVQKFGGEVNQSQQDLLQEFDIEIPVFPLVLCPILTNGLSLLFAAWIRKRKNQETSFIKRLNESAWQIVPWGMIPVLWFFGWFTSLIAGDPALVSIVYTIPHFCFGLSYAGLFYCMISGIYERYRISSEDHDPGSRSLESVSIKMEAADSAVEQNNRVHKKPEFNWKVIIPVLLYTLVFTAMNWALYFNLMIPHGDSGMYEEHLYNLLHGKGFRSYLDQGLFLGEHIQVIHLLLIPFYLCWQSMLNLEFLQSLALGLSAVPVYRIAKKSSGSEAVGLFMAAATLCYFPLQFLDISIDLKTFRPTAFCIPAMLWGLEAMENRRYRWMSFWFIVTLSGQEDLTLVLGPVGLWLVLSSAWQSYREQGVLFSSKLWKNQGFCYGIFWMCLSPIYLFIAMKAIHWFRDGVEIHYANYFQKFGNTMTEVIITMATRPGFLISELSTTSTLTYFLALVLPLGFLPLRSPGRLATGAILFITLCLNELDGNKVRVPLYHFHAPIIPVIFWSAAMGFKQGESHSANKMLFVKNYFTSLFFPRGEIHKSIHSEYLAIFALCAALGSGLFFTLTPMGVTFWDAGSSWNGYRLYVQKERARMFSQITEIPQSAKVSSTDFVHTRYTHHMRSYDYSNFRRRQSNFENKTPDDTDYIVIDTAHQYSTIKKVEDLREWKEERDLWEVMPDKTRGYYIVLKRVK